ncbi:DUF928 domain-containing protein [Pedobacter sp. CCM 8938]|uniref:DUF928 domain-containing protein n=1 Tax=Pedobacter fastidiosus TaxID=2765361 RepID=A0ABR7KSE7_9SPHI|nr:DUF928 domain-containing protein [Pedobacter fastidiosus]MBC6110692.1 DUF928 domain-containing protein [Pedobacter fastidiosus]
MNITLLFCMLFIGKGLMAQISIQFVPEVNGTTVSGLFRASIYNLSGSRSVRMNITVTEARAGRILTVQTGVFTIVPGNNSIPQGVARAATVAIGENATANFIRRNQYFPQGDYDYDFNIIAASSSDELIDQVFSNEITPPAPLDLIEPYDQDEICEKRPLLTWQPSLPAIPGLLYQLMLVEIREKQSAVEALNYNLPVVNQKGIAANLLLYPPNSKDLEKGRKYAWQVTAYKEQTVINRSDVWSFEVNCQDTVGAVPETDYGYRDIEDLAKGNFYVADGTVRFALINSYGDQKLRYSISCISHPDSRVRNLPTVKLKKGQNKITLDISRNFSFKDGYSYVMVTELPGGGSRSLRFIFRDKKE